MRFTCRMVSVVAFLGAVSWLPQTATAGTLSGPTCVTDTFSAYRQLNGSGGCNSGVLQLLNFDLFTIDASGGLQAASQNLLDAISVSPVWNSVAANLQLTIGGFTPFPVDAAHSAGYQIRFTVDPAPILLGESMAMDPPFGNVTGAQSYCTDSVFVSNPGGPGFCSNESSPGQTSFGIGRPAVLTFVPPLFTLDTRTSVLLNPNLDTASGFDGLVFNFQTTGVPEPGTWGLIAASLTCLAFARSRATRLPNA